MNKRTKILITLPFLLIFLSGIVIQDTLAQPTVTFEIEVEVVTGPPRDNCPPAYDPVDGASITVTATFPVAGTNLSVPNFTSSGTTSGGIYTATGSVAVSYPLGALQARPQVLGTAGAWNITVTLTGCPPGYQASPPSRTRKGWNVTGSVATGFHVQEHIILFCRCATRPPRTAMALPSPTDRTTVVATVAVREEEKVQVAQQVGAQVVTTVMVNDEPRDFVEADRSVPISPGDDIQLLGTFGHILAQFAFVPEGEISSPPGTTPVVECPEGQPAVVSVPGSYTDTPTEDMVVTTAPVGTALTTGPEEVPAVTAPAGEVAITPTGGLEPIIKTDDTVVAAGQLDDSAMGSNEITLTDRNTGEVLGETQVDTWRLAGASLDPPVVDRGGETNLRLNIFGPPNMPVEVTATADEGLTPREVTTTAPLGVLQSQGVGSFTATKSGTHGVSVEALPIVY